MILRLLVYLTIALLTTRTPRTRRSDPMPDTIFEDTAPDNGIGDVEHSDENPVLAREPVDHADVFLNYRIARHPDGHRALRVWANGKYIDITASQAQELSILLAPAAVDLADIRQDIGGES